MKVEESVMAYVISVISGKGGVGKSTTAIGLAEALCSLGEKVLLVDGDLQFGYDHVLLGKNPTCSIQDVINKTCKPEHATIEIRKNLFLLPTSNMGRMKMTEGFLDPYEGQYSFIVVDLPAGDVDEMFAFYDIVCAVIEPRAASISVVKSLYSKLIDMNPNANFVALMNKLTKKDRMNYETVLSNINVPIIGYISDDPECTTLGCNNHYSLKNTKNFKYYVNSAKWFRDNNTPIIKPKKGWFL